MGSNQWKTFFGILVGSAREALVVPRLLALGTLVSLLSPLTIPSLFQQSGPFEDRVVTVSGWLTSHPIAFGAVLFGLSFGYVFSKATFLVALSSTRHSDGLLVRAVRLFPRYFGLEVLVISTIFVFAAILSVPVMSVEDNPRLTANLTALAFSAFVAAFLFVSLIKTFSSFYLTKDVGVRSALELSTRLFSRHAATIVLFGLSFIVALTALAFVTGYAYQSFVALLPSQHRWSPFVLGATLLLMNGYLYAFTVRSWYGFFLRVARSHGAARISETSQKEETVLQHEVSRGNI